MHFVQRAFNYFMKRLNFVIVGNSMHEATKTVLIWYWSFWNIIADRIRNAVNICALREKKINVFQKLDIKNLHNSEERTQIRESYSKYK